VSPSPALLRARRIDAWPALVHSRRLPPAKDVPTLAQFDRVLVAVREKKKEGLRFFAPYPTAAMFGYIPEAENAEALVLLPGEPRFVRVTSAPKAATRAKTNATVTLAADGSATGSLSAMLAGYFDEQARLDLRDLSEAELDLFFQNALSRFSKDSTETHRTLSDPGDLLTPLNFTQEFTARDFGIVQSGILLVEVPDFPYGFATFDAYPTLEERETPYQLPTEGEEWYVFRLKVPEGYEPLYFPKPFRYEADYGVFTLETSYSREQGEVRIIRGFVFTDRTVPRESYAEFKQQLDELGKLKYRLILLQKAD